MVYKKINDPNQVHFETKDDLKKITKEWKIMKKKAANNKELYSTLIDDWYKQLPYKK